MSSSAETPAIPALKNILYATDFSLSSEAAMPVVRALAVRFGSTVHFVHVVAPEGRSALLQERPPQPDAQLTDAEDELQFQLAGDRWRGIPHTSTVERGEVWKVIASLVEQRNIDLIVLGTHGRRGLRKLVLGSTAEQVIRMAPCPALTVGPHAKPANEAPAGAPDGPQLAGWSEDAGSPASPQLAGWGDPVLFATDFSPGAQYGVRYAASWARANHSRLVLLHAVQPIVDVTPGDIDPMPVTVALSAELASGAQAYAAGRMAELIAAEKLQELKPELIIQSGPAAEVILAAAREKKAGLIVMGAHRAWSQSMAGHLPWATASAILCEAPCPVITVRD
jgi:nucleotide-binding universal stress UspA family protein